MGKKIILNISYKAKIILCCFFVISIPYTSGLVYLYKNIVTSAQTELMSAIENRMDQEQAAIESKLEAIRHSAYFFSANSLLTRFFTPNFYNDIQIVEDMNNTIMPLMSWMEATTQGIGGFRFFTPIETVPENEFFIYSPPYKEEPWMQAVMGNSTLSSEGYAYEPIHAPRTFPYAGHDPEPVFSLFYRLPGTDFISPTYLEVDIPPRQLFSSLNTTPVVRDGFLICLSDDGREITGRQLSAQEELLLQNKLLPALLKEPSASGTFTAGSFRYFVSSRRLPQLQAAILSVVPSENVDGSARKTRILFIVIVTSLTLLLFGLSYIGSTLLLRRIVQMQKAVHKMQEGDFNIHIPVHGHDEIDELALSMNTMSVQINNLINTVYKAEVRQKETEILALHSQINPHFLFNTLETFRMMAELEDFNQLADSIAMLGNLMRYNITLGRQTVTLQNELNIIEDYAGIQNLLHNNRITLHCLIEPEYASLGMPNFILQPLVENSILHGLEDNCPFIEIYVSLEALASSFRITVWDNGIGVASERLESIRHMLSDSSGENRTSIGLINVNQRLILFFGSESGLIVNSSPGEGFQVQFSIPR